MSYPASLRQLERDLGDLLDRHERGRDLSEFESYADDPVAFIREVLGGEPWEKQVEIACDLRDHPLVVVRGCNASGKDWLAARLALWWVYARRGLVLVTGPTERQVREVVMGEVARAFRSAQDLPGELFASALRLGRGEAAGILAFTSTESSRLTGFHAARVLGVLTEAQGVEDFAWEGVLACATGSEDRVLAVGNPLAPSGRFYTASRATSGWRPIRISAEEHPNLRGAPDAIPGGPSRQFAARLAKEYGRSSPIYQARVLGEFPDSGEDSLITRSWIDRAFELHEGERFRAEATEEEPVVAVDPARFGPDHTVLAVTRGPLVERLMGWARADLMESVDRIVLALRENEIRPNRWSRGRVIVDEVGVGAGVADRLSELGYKVELFNGGRSPWAAVDQDRFANMRAEAYWRLRELLEAGEIGLPPDEDLADELLATTWRPTAEGRIALPPKERTKALIGRSPDRADAVSMAAWWWWQTRESRVTYDIDAWGPPLKR